MIKKYKVAVLTNVNLGFYDKINKKPIVETYKPSEVFEIDFEKINQEAKLDYLTDIFSQEYRGNIIEVGYEYPTVDVQKGSKDIPVDDVSSRQSLIQNKSFDAFKKYQEFQKNKSVKK